MPPLLAPRRGRVQQKGLGAYTLCGKCNNDTGAWYGGGFVDYCKKGMHLLTLTGGKSKIDYQIECYPLAILKQTISMFLSINPVSVVAANPALVRFVLNRDRKFLDPKYRFFTYLNRSGIHRMSPLTGVFSLNTQTGQSGSSSILTEFSFPPFGYIMTFDSGAPQRDLVEITHFQTYGYNEKKYVSLSYPVYETNSVYPLDYRTNEEFTEAIKIGKAEMESWEKQ